MPCLQRYNGFPRNKGRFLSAILDISIKQYCQTSSTMSKSCGLWRGEGFTQIQDTILSQKSLQPFQGSLSLDCTCWGFQASGMPDRKCQASLRPLSDSSASLPCFFS